MNCLHCRAETTNGLALCETCQYGVSVWLTYLPIHFRNLSRNQRPGRPNGSMGTAGQWLIRRGEVDPSLIPKALGKANNDLVTWALAFTKDRPLDLPDGGETEAEQVTALCAWFTEHLTSIATLEWAGQFVRDIGKHERALSELTQSAVPGWYAGTCRQTTGRDMEGGVYVCGTETYVVPGLTWLTCSGCGTTTAARDHLPFVLEEARGWVARPKALAEAIVALVDTEQSVPRLYDRIRQWAVRERIETIQFTTRVHAYDAEADRIVVREEATGHPRYRLGEVLDALRVEGATRLRDTTSAKAG